MLKSVGQFYDLDDLVWRVFGAVIENILFNQKMLMFLGAKNLASDYPPVANSEPGSLGSIKF